MAESDACLEKQIMELEDLIQDPEYAVLYYCPARTCKNCRCLEKFVAMHHWMGTNLGGPRHALLLLKLFQLRLSNLSKDLYKIADTSSENVDDPRWLREYLDMEKLEKYGNYIAETRRKLRFNGICSAARKNVLMYPKNFIHLILIFYFNLRNDLIAQGKLNLTQIHSLIPLEQLIYKNCCKNQCMKQLGFDFKIYSDLRSEGIFFESREKDPVEQLLNLEYLNGEICDKSIKCIVFICLEKLDIIRKKFAEETTHLHQENTQTTIETSQIANDNSRILETNTTAQSDSTSYEAMNTVNHHVTLNSDARNMDPSLVNYQEFVHPRTSTSQMFVQENDFSTLNPTTYLDDVNPLFQPTDQTTLNTSIQRHHNNGNSSQENFSLFEDINVINGDGRHPEFTWHDVDYNLNYTYLNYRQPLQDITNDIQNHNLRIAEFGEYFNIHPDSIFEMETSDEYQDETPISVTYEEMDSINTTES
ncbi:hypothetical protein RF11_11564 [Thelohanellus kitauei]|uniref:Uncharacterized protein n=1 Tax=Thelohanellus kitauei TaxID=669202 RepID=A0A0C2MLF9_THEKT|nr:hypothetical protein RF11_11564 [Thelohanellus kitauei]